MDREPHGTSDREENADLLIVGVATLFAVLAVTFDAGMTSILAVVAGPLLVFFLPGYAIVLAALPRLPFAQREDTLTRSNGVLRLGLSIGTSLAISGGIGIAMSLTGVPLTRVTAAGGIAAITLCGVVVAWYRRRRIPELERQPASFAGAFQTARERLTNGPVTARVLPALVVIAVLASGSLVVVSVDSPPDAERYTELYALPAEESGSQSPEEFPDSMSVNGSRDVVLGIENKEHARVDYTLVVIAQRTDGDQSVLTEIEKEQFEVSLTPNESWETQYTYRPDVTGDSVRVAFLLYRGDAPANPSLESAYREVHFWVDIGQNRSSRSGAEMRPRSLPAGGV